MKDLFNRLAGAVTQHLGSPIALVLAFGIVLAWALSGPVLGFSETWQLAINTGTTIITFLMVFVIQNAQNRDSKAVHAKLDEILRVLPDARGELIDAENEPEDILDQQIAGLRALAREHPDLNEALVSRLDDLSGSVGSEGRGSGDAAGDPSGESRP